MNMENTLIFKGDISLYEAINSSLYDIYSYAIIEIKKNIDININELKEIKVVKIKINDTDFIISMNTYKILSILNDAMYFFESIEEYEKCQECLTLINKLKK